MIGANVPWTRSATGCTSLGSVSQPKRAFMRRENAVPTAFSATPPSRSG